MSAADNEWWTVTGSESMPVGWVGRLDKPLNDRWSCGVYDVERREWCWQMWSRHKDVLAVASEEFAAMIRDVPFEEKSRVKAAADLIADRYLREGKP